MSYSPCDDIEPQRTALHAELEVELSVVQARILLSFLLKEIAPTVYNAGVTAVETFLRDRWLISSAYMSTNLLIGLRAHQCAVSKRLPK